MSGEKKVAYCIPRRYNRVKSICEHLQVSPSSEFKTGERAVSPSSEFKTGERAVKRETGVIPVLSRNCEWPVPQICHWRRNAAGKAPEPQTGHEPGDLPAEDGLKVTVHDG